MKTALRTILLTCLWMGAAGADERLTTWRSGDVLSIAWGCKTAEATAEQFEYLVENEQFARIEGCWVVRRPIPAILKAWVQGGFVANDVPGSMWRVLDSQGDWSYIMLSDQGGPHTQGMAL